MAEKKCTKCGESRAVESFHRRSSSGDGLATWCKSCCKEYSKAYRAENTEKEMAYLDENSERIKARNAEYYKRNRARIRAKQNADPSCICSM